jgi:tetratricopeptide (TPR) repeat protein
VPREFDLIAAQAQVASFEGRLRDAVALYGRAADLATARSLSGTASGFWAHLAMTEAFYDDQRRASDRIQTIVGRTASAAENPGTIPRFRAAVALGLVGLGTEARELVSGARQRYPESTLTRTVFIPTSDAAIALGRGAPAEAITALEAATPTEFGTVAALVPTFLRGEAYLAKADLEAARREYQKVLDHRGSDPFAPVIPLAHLGLARAWQQSGDVDRSVQVYDALLQIWKNADPDLPLLQRTREERARLISSRPAPR